MKRLRKILPTVSLLLAIASQGYVRLANAEQAWPRPLLSFSLERQPSSPAEGAIEGGDATAATGVRGMAWRVPQGGKPAAVQVDRNVLNNAEGSVLVWWRPEWSIPDTHRDFGQQGSILKGYYLLPVDRPFHSPVWHHLATTWNSFGEVRHYVDGEMVGCGVRAAGPDPDARLWLGCSTIWSLSNEAPAPPPWAVTVDESVVLPRALSVEEIQAEYLAGKIACGEMAPSAVAGDRLIDVRLGDSIFVGDQIRAACGFPSIARDTDGTLYLFGKIGAEGYTAGVRWFRSTDGGKTWTLTQVSTDWDAPQKSASETPVSPTGESSRFVALRGVPTTGGRRLTVRWGAPTTESGVVEGSLHYLDESGAELPVEEATLELPMKRYRAPEAARIELPVVVRALDGGLLDVVFVSEPDRQKANAMLIKSTDEGRTWKYLSTIAPDTYGIFPEGTNESALFRGGDGSLACIVRTGEPLIVARSLDDGLTWQPWEFLGVVGVMPDAITLSDGLVACAVGRPDVNLIVSLDADGKQWSLPFQLYNANRVPHEFCNEWHQHGTFYAHLAEAEPGRVLVLYDTMGTVRIPGRLPRFELWIQEVLVGSIPHFTKARQEALPVTSPRFSFSGEWRLPRPGQWEAPPYASTSQDGAEVSFTFTGTGLAAQVMILPDGGDLEVWIDGKQERVLKTAGSQTYWLARHVLARGLAPGTHKARLVARCQGVSLPALSSIQELMGSSAPEVVMDCRGATRVALQTFEPFAEK